MSIILSFVFFFTPLVTAFSFSAGTPTQCDSLSVSWSGGTAPFFLHLIPVFGTPTNLSIPTGAVNNGQGSFSITQLQIAQGDQFVLSMSDATGFATGGTSSLMTVGASKGGRCSSTGPVIDFSFQLNSDLVQCRPYTFSGYTDAVPPVSIFGVIPSGASFVLHPPTNAPSFSWIANEEHGTPIIFMMTDSAGGQGGSSSVRVVADSGDSSCLNGLSSTSAAPTTGQARPTKSTTSSAGAPSSSSSGPASSGSSSAGAIVGTVIGGLLFVAVVVTLGMFFFKKRREAQKAPATASGFPSYGGGHMNGYSLSSAVHDFHPTPHSPYAPHTPQSYNAQTPYGPEPPYGHTYPSSQYAPSTYAPSARTQMYNHNHTTSEGGFGAYDGYQGSMLPYDANPFLDNPHQPQQYPPSNHAYQSTYQLPSASAYTLPHSIDPFSPPAVDREQPLPPLPPPSVAAQDPFITSTESVTTADSTTSAQQRKATMANKFYESSVHIMVHRDAEDVLPPPDVNGVIELPPQYSERRGGLTVVNQSPPSPSSSSHLPLQHQPSVS